MQVSCPECSAAQEGAPGETVVCPACLTPFLVPAEARAVREFDVQHPDGSVTHQVARHAIRETLYTGRIPANAKVRHEDGKWETIGGYPEFAAILRLLGDDLGPLAGTRKLAGWKGSISEMSSPLMLPPESARPSMVEWPPPFQERPALPPPPPRRPPPPPPEPSGVPNWAFGAIAAVVLLSLLAIYLS